MEDTYAPALALQKSSTKEPDYKYCLVAGWIVFSSAHKPIDCLGTSLETVQGESAGVGRLDFFERDPSTVGSRICRVSTNTVQLCKDS